MHALAVLLHKRLQELRSWMIENDSCCLPLITESAENSLSVLIDPTTPIVLNNKKVARIDNFIENGIVLTKIILNNR